MVQVVVVPVVLVVPYRPSGLLVPVAQVRQYPSAGPASILLPVVAVARQLKETLEQVGPVTVVTAQLAPLLVEQTLVTVVVVPELLAALAVLVVQVL